MNPDFSSIGYVGGKWSILGTSMLQLAKFASDFVLHAPVLDGTGLDGSFEYRQDVPDLDPKYDDSNYQTDSFLSLIRELGFKLERTKGPIEILVIDSAARPSPN